MYCKLEESRTSVCVGEGVLTASKIDRHHVVLAECVGARRTFALSVDEARLDALFAKHVTTPRQDDGFESTEASRAFEHFL